MMEAANPNPGAMVGRPAVQWAVLEGMVSLGIHGQTRHAPACSPGAETFPNNAVSTYLAGFGAVSDSRLLAIP